MLQKLLDFDKVCFEGAIVEEERRVGPRGEVFELRWLPGEDTEKWRRRRTVRWERQGKHPTWLFDSVYSIRLF